MVVQPIVEPVKPEEIAQVISESEKEILTESVAADQQQNNKREPKTRRIHSEVV